MESEGSVLGRVDFSQRFQRCMGVIEREAGVGVGHAIRVVQGSHHMEIFSGKGSMQAKELKARTKNQDAAVIDHEVFGTPDSYSAWGWLVLPLLFVIKSALIGILCHPPFSRAPPPISFNCIAQIQGARGLKSQNTLRQIRTTSKYTMIKCLPIRDRK